MKKIALLVMAIIIPTTIWAETIYKSGEAKRILVDNKYYGQCMVNMGTPIENGCASSWVSLDCEGKYSNKGMGDRMLNIALIANTMKKKVSLKIDTTKTFNGYCTATRIDLID